MPSFPYANVPFVVIELLQRKDQLLIEAWYLPERDDDPRDVQSPLRLLYRTPNLAQAAMVVKHVSFGDLLHRKKVATVLIHRIDGHGYRSGAGMEIPISGEPEILGLIGTGT